MTEMVKIFTRINAHTSNFDNLEIPHDQFYNHFLLVIKNGSLTSILLVRPALMKDIKLYKRKNNYGSEKIWN